MSIYNENFQQLGIEENILKIIKIYENPSTTNILSGERLNAFAFRIRNKTRVLLLLLAIPDCLLLVYRKTNDF